MYENLEAATVRNRMLKIPLVMDESKQCNKSNPQLGLDEACLEVISSATNPISLWAQSEECEMCDFIEVARIPANNTVPLLLTTTFPIDIYLKNNHSTYCYEKYKFEEHGIYAWDVTGDSCSGVRIIQNPDISYISIVVAFFIYLAAFLLWMTGKLIYSSDWLTQIRVRRSPFSELESDLGSPSSTDGPPLIRSEVARLRGRVKSLDVFRGISISLMIFVNYGGGHYWFFKHTPWNGLTVADLVFPWFLWIMGASMAISLRSYLRSCISRKRLFLRVLLRSVTLVALGVILNSSGNKKNSITNLRLPGVLQRIGLAYFVVASLETVFMKPQGSFEYGNWLVVQDLLESWVQWLIILALTITHILLTFMMPVPNCPTGYLGPGGLHNHSSSPNCTGGAAGYIDRMVFGERHIYQHPTCRPVYETVIPYDPEGLLGTLTSILLVYLGVQAGRIILCYHYTSSRIARWALWAFNVGLIAGILCDFTKNDGVVPVNKNLWSLSFVLGVASTAFLLQSFLYFIVDAKNWWSGSPFHYAGMNSIVLYIGHEVTKNLFPWSWQPYYRSHEEYLAMNLWGTTLWMLIAFVLYKKNVFVTV
ncbi:heparan-alpha-glucosaminide N-acetyltransferase-like isoform X2 [Zootermopsis nevadensis]|uniref:heparan-alpha-glucosaminide N-acetyltransferase-like isoform X2 n=1 Tax=Zootermopsis nevadensis TaxID=136037 RepID=UPI000B8EA972|nr:heparan-alpha-glucosaminide N-acetyltransferase-like isoform X2 [Zootermopsis nevadensis]